MNAVVGEDAASKESNERGGDGEELHFGFGLVSWEVGFVVEMVGKNV